MEGAVNGLPARANQLWGYKWDWIAAWAHGHDADKEQEPKTKCLMPWQGVCQNLRRLFTTIEAELTVQT